MLKKLAKTIIIVLISISSPVIIPLITHAATNETTLVNALATVQVSGSVNKPGIYKVPQGTRLVDVIAKAGGLKKDAVLTDINLTTPVTDGTTIYIASKTEKVNVTKVEIAKDKNAKPVVAEKVSKKNEPKKEKPEEKVIKNTTASNGLISLNKATVEELDSLPGVGEKLAKSIIKYRNQHGRFRDIAELNNITGIGDKKLKKIRARVTL